MSDYTEQELEDMLAARRRKKLEAAMPAIGSVTAAHLDQLRNELHESVRQEIGKLRELVQATTAETVPIPPTPRQPAPAEQVGFALMLEQGMQLIGAALSEEQQLWLSQKPVRDPMKWGAFLSSDIGKAATRSVVEAAQQFFKQAGF